MNVAHHVARLPDARRAEAIVGRAVRLGLTASDNPVVIEKDLMPLFPRQGWGDINHYLVLLGREVCQARKPLCGECPLADVCPKNGVRP